MVNDNIKQINQFLNKLRIGLVCDVDGTLSPITLHPDEARVTEKNRQVLKGLQQRFALIAFLSGRGAGDIRKRVGLPGAVYVGNHGLERWQNGQIAVMPEARPFRPALESALQAIASVQVPGMYIEDKGATLSVHYRQTKNPVETARSLLPHMEKIAAKHGLGFFQGRMVFEFRPPIEANKGTAFKSLVLEYNLDGAMFIGDDTTDVPAIQMAKNLREQGACYALGVGVDSEGTPDSVRESADFVVREVSGVESLLTSLLESSSASST